MATSAALTAAATGKRRTAAGERGDHAETPGRGQEGARSRASVELGEKHCTSSDRPSSPMICTRMGSRLWNGFARRSGSARRRVALRRTEAFTRRDASGEGDHHAGVADTAEPRSEHHRQVVKRARKLVDVLDHHRRARLCGRPGSIFQTSKRPRCDALGDRTEVRGDDTVRFERPSWSFSTDRDDRLVNQPNWSPCVAARLIQALSNVTPESEYLQRAHSERTCSTSVRAVRLAGTRSAQQGDDGDDREHARQDRRSRGSHAVEKVVRWCEGRPAPPGRPRAISLRRAGPPRNHRDPDVAPLRTAYSY